MNACLLQSRKPFPWFRLGLVALLTVLLSGWTTCSAIVNFKSCEGAVTHPAIASISPESIPTVVDSILLTVSGSGFDRNSQVMWNGNPLPTTFDDSRHLQTTITQQTLDTFGGSTGSNVQISVRSQSDGLSGCAKGGDSSTLLLVID